jgi:hypothetical protein
MPGRIEPKREEVVGPFRDRPGPGARPDQQTQAAEALFFCNDQGAWDAGLRKQWMVPASVLAYSAPLATAKP